MSLTREFSFINFCIMSKCQLVISFDLELAVDN
ncbi:hypothetical protein T08_10324 [Trichinella sp. T8]|nr:hypothetical protein T08_10324 [Trichinella sp. T8]